MKRVQLFEFEDLSWFPSTFRSTMTKIIVVLHKLLGTQEILSNLLTKARQKTPFTRVVDMGSGSGGIMPSVARNMNQGTEEPTMEFLLTDLHPNKTFVEQFNQNGFPHTTYSREPLDATDLSQAPEGMKTLVNSFHHMPPEVARKILATAQKNREPILIYEIGKNMVPLWAWWLLLPITLPMVALMAILFVPFVKPLKWQDLLFTWFIPVIPVFYAWDGQASGPRTYTFKDVEELLPQKVDSYTWEMGDAKKANGKAVGYYILGIPE